jgi:phosphonate transport system substrate-binding protein
MKRKIARIGAALTLVASAVLVIPATVSAEIRFGMLPRLGGLELHAMLDPLADYLTRETGEKVSLFIPKDFQAFKEAVMAGHIDVGFANPLVYIHLKKDVSIEPLAVASEHDGGTRFRGIIIARKDSSVSSLQDLKGKKLIFVDKNSAGGYMFQMLLLRKAGLDTRRDFTLLPFAKKHDNVTMAVLNRNADAGGIREGDLKKRWGKGDFSQIKIIGYTDYFPNWPVFSTSKLSTAAKARIKAALLKLKTNRAHTLEVLSAAELTGFSPISDKDYDELRKAAKLAETL